jgi:mono/diheme cytochrome c family protein
MSVMWFARWAGLGACLAACLAGGTVRAASDPAVAVKEIFRAQCLECHGGASTRVHVKVLDRDDLVKRGKVIPGKPEDSPLFQRIRSTDDDRMPPPPGHRPLSADQIEEVRRWIDAGAPAFPPDVKVTKDISDDAIKGVIGVNYVLKRILADVGRLDSRDRPFVRYFSINHVLTGGASAQELDLQRAALAKAINHLSLAPRLVVPVPVDRPTNTIYRVDIRQLGWDRKPFEGSNINLFDLVLLEYPYGMSYESSDAARSLTTEFLEPAHQVRPVLYLRGDWFASVATQPPLYDDLLEMPLDLKDFEERRLGLDSADARENGLAKRAGMAVSGVSHNNRVVERYAVGGGAYWKSYDYRTSRGADNIFQDPIHLQPAGGEMIFTLPNGLQGYLLADGKGRRLNEAPTAIVTDTFAADQTVRDGLSCMRCHENGMMKFTDQVRPTLLRLPDSPGFDRRRALQLYPGQQEMARWVREDAARFRSALKEVLGGEPGTEPLTPVSRRYLDDPITLTTAARELGVTDPRRLAAVFQLPKFIRQGLSPLVLEDQDDPKAVGVIRRDTWENAYGPVARAIGLGTPILPLDSLQERDLQPSPTPFDVELKTNKKLFEAGDKLVIEVVNHSPKPIHIELFGTSTTGKKVMLTKAPVALEAGKTFRFPPEGEDIVIRPIVGKEQVTLFACESDFPAGVVLKAQEKEVELGRFVTDRVVHPFYPLGNDERPQFDPATIIKKTIDIETR